MRLRRVPCVVCGTPTTHGAACAHCATGLTHADAEYRANRAVVIASATRCWICGRPFAEGEAITVDHVIALAKGGTHALGNLRPAHDRCNKRKGGK